MKLFYDEWTLTNCPQIIIYDRGVLLYVPSPLGGVIVTQEIEDRNPLYRLEEESSLSSSSTISKPYSPRAPFPPYSYPKGKVLNFLRVVTKWTNKKMKSEVLLWCLSLVSCAKNEEKLRKRKEKSQREFIRPRITKEPTDKIAKWDETSKF